MMYKGLWWLVAVGSHVLPVQYPFPHLLIAPAFQTGTSPLLSKDAALIKLLIKAMSSPAQGSEAPCISFLFAALTVYHKPNELKTTPFYMSENSLGCIPFWNL